MLSNTSKDELNSNTQKKFKILLLFFSFPINEMDPRRRIKSSTIKFLSGLLTHRHSKDYKLSRPCEHEQFLEEKWQEKKFTCFSFITNYVVPTQIH